MLLPKLAISSLAFLLPLVTGKGLFEPSTTRTSVQRSSLDRRIIATANVDICESLALVVPLTTVYTCVTTQDTYTTVLGQRVLAVAGHGAVCTWTAIPNVASVAGTNGCLNTMVATQVTLATVGLITVQVPTQTCLTISETDYQISAGTCLCVTGGQMTQASLNSISAAVTTNTQLSTALATIKTNTGVTISTTAITNYLNGIELNILVSDGKTNKCNYPAGAIPNCNGVCTFTCPSGYSVCGTVCSTSCISGKPSRRRSYTPGGTDFRCPKGRVACAATALTLMPGKHVSNFDCIDTETDIESCGGCAIPLDVGVESGGRDCTAISNAIGVRCHHGGCIVDTCEKGFVVSSTGDACIAKVSNKSSHW